MAQNVRKRILVVQDLATSILLRQALSSEGYELVETTSGEEALARISPNPVDLAIVEIDLPGMDGYHLCRQLRQNPATRNMPIIMLTSRVDVSNKLAGFEAGAEDYLTKPFVPQELAYRIRVLVARGNRQPVAPPPPQTHGRIIAIFGTKGGVGRTTIGVNLAVALQRRTRKKVALVDADFFFGDVALHLNVPPSHTVLDLIDHIDHLDSDLLEQVLVPHPSGIRVLLSPRNPEDVDLIQPTHIHPILNSLTACYDYIIVDCQSSYDERSLAILEKADVILLVIKPEVGCVKNMAIFSELAIKLGLSFDDKIRIVLNRSGSKSGIGTKEIERIFRRQISFHIGSGGNSVVLSINRGVPLTIEQPNHPFSLQVGQIADYLSRAFVAVAA